MNIREASTADILLIRSLAFATWPVAYKEMISPEQIAYMLELMYSEASLREQISEKGHRFLIAEQDGRSIGFASHEPHHLGATRTRLHKLYVLPDVQGSGAGGMLLETVMEAGKAAGDRAIDLTVNKRNKALRFYQRRGFVIERDMVVDIGNGFVMDDHVMVLAL